MKNRDLMKLLLQEGWELKQISGSHHVLQKGDQIEVLPIHGRDVPTGLLVKILKRTGLK